MNDVAGCLTQAEIRRLTAWKARYSLEAMGFDRHQAFNLLLLRWLVHRRESGASNRVCRPSSWGGYV